MIKRFVMGSPESGRGGEKGPATGRGKRLGIGGECVCPSCGTKAVHQAGNPCYQMKCPTCGSSMARK